MQDWVMEILRCPVTHSQLGEAATDLLQTVNERIAAGELQTRAGEPVADAVATGLVNESHSLLYVVVDQIPTLIPDDAIVIGEVPATPTDAHDTENAQSEHADE